MPRSPLGSVIAGSLSKGLVARVERKEELRAGSFVIVEDGGSTFFSLVSDLELAASDESFLSRPPVVGSLAEKTLRGSMFYTNATLKPSLVLTPAGDLGPVRTIPGHFAPVSAAANEDYVRVFGDPTESKDHFAIGTPLESDVPIALNLPRFVERSNGIFGKSGTGKSFLTRLALTGTILKGACVNLVFDMHNEYGWEAKSEESNTMVKGLRQLFPTRVQTWTLDQNMKEKVDARIRLSYEDIQVGDLELLASELNFSPAAFDSVAIIQRKYGRKWLETFLTKELDYETEFPNANVESLRSLHRKLSRLADAPFLTSDPKESTMQKMIDTLSHGTSVVVQFGHSYSPLNYVLIANVITRRLHDLWVHATERAHEGKGDPPPQLMITIEEAHKFLSPAVASQTTFGTIARELRKYNMTLLVVDQRPSSIDPEILSQIGTRITALLTDEKDIDAVLTGAPDANRLKGILASLDSRQQVLLLGHALPMPIVLRTRTYGKELYAEIDEEKLPKKRSIPKTKTEKLDLPPPPKRGAADAAGETVDQEAIDAIFGPR